MRQNKFRWLLFMMVALSIPFLQWGCKREGCTDPIALNYCSKCNTNDGSCEYEITIAFWYDSALVKRIAQYNAQFDPDVDTLELYLHAETVFSGVIAKFKPDVPLSQEPSCSDPRVFTKKLRYVHGKMPDVCQSGSGGFFPLGGGGGTKCWILKYEISDPDIGILGGSQIIIGPGEYGCKTVKME